MLLRILFFTSYKPAGGPRAVEEDPGFLTYDLDWSNYTGSLDPSARYRVILDIEAVDTSREYDVLLDLRRPYAVEFQLSSPPSQPENQSYDFVLSPTPEPEGYKEFY